MVRKFSALLVCLFSLIFTTPIGFMGEACGKSNAQKISSKRKITKRKKYRRIKKTRRSKIRRVSYSYMLKKEPVAAVVFNANTKKIVFQKNANKAWHPASLTKKMTLYMLFEAVVAGDITMNTKFKVSKLASRQAPSKLGLRPGSYIKVKDIIMALITKSANDASTVAAEGLAGSRVKFVAKMNRKAKSLGMRLTVFRNASGLPDARHTSTANDMTKLGFALYNHFPEFYHLFKEKNFVYMGRSHRNHNHMLKSYQGMDGMKTGFTNASGFNISTSAVRYNSKGKPIRLFAVVFGGKNRHVRDAYAAKILDTSFKKLGAMQPPDKLDAFIHEISLRG